MKQNLGTKVATANSFFRFLIDVPLKAKSKKSGSVRFAHDLNVQMNDWIPICVWQDAEPPRDDIYVHGNFTPPTHGEVNAIHNNQKLNYDTHNPWLGSKLKCNTHSYMVKGGRPVCGKGDTLWLHPTRVVSHVMTLPAYTMRVYKGYAFNEIIPQFRNMFSVAIIIQTISQWGTIRPKDCKEGGSLTVLEGGIGMNKID